MLELVFRALFFAIDGKSSGPESYKGPIGKEHSLIMINIQKKYLTD